MIVRPARLLHRRIISAAALALACGFVAGPAASALTRDAGPTSIDPSMAAPMAGAAPDGARSPSGLPVPRIARRHLDVAVIAASEPTTLPGARPGSRRLPRDLVLGACPQPTYLTINGQDHLVADFGSGVRMREVESVQLLRDAGFGWDVMEDALATMTAESLRCPATIHNNLDPATGQVRSVDIGLWQINTKWHPRYASWDLKDPVANTTAAKELYDRYGFTPWHGYANRALFAGWARLAIQQAQEQGVH